MQNLPNLPTLWQLHFAAFPLQSPSFQGNEPSWMSEETPRRGGRQQPHQTLKKSKKYKGGQEAPHDGDAINPKDA
jgi:hypothetical protein